MELRNYLSGLNIQSCLRPDQQQLERPSPNPAKFDEIEDALLKIENLMVDSGETDVGDVHDWLEKDKYFEGLVILERAFRESAKDSEIRAQVLIAMAIVLFEQERFVDSKRCLETASEILDNRKVGNTLQVAQAYEKMGMLYERMEEYELALSLFERMFAVLDDRPREVKCDAYLIRARNFLLSGKLSDAISLLWRKRALKLSAAEKDSIDPKHIGLDKYYKYIGAAYLMAGKSKLAAEMFTSMLNFMDMEEESSSLLECDALLKAYGIMKKRRVKVAKQELLVDRMRLSKRWWDQVERANQVKRAEEDLKQVVERARVASDAFQELVKQFISN